MVQAFTRLGSPAGGPSLAMALEAVEFIATDSCSFQRQQHDIRLIG